MDEKLHEECKILVDSMSKRVKMVIDDKGAHTQY